GQLMSEVPVGVMSSGGLDSGLVTALAGTGGVNAGFCYRAPAQGYDELREARLASEPFGVAVEEITIPEAEVPGLLEKLTWHNDEPLPRPHHLAAYAVARRAREAGFKVLLAGEGGDELFGGYTRYGELAARIEETGDDAAVVFAHNRVALPRIARFFR